MNETQRKILALPNDVKSYFYIGHGTDVCDPDTHEVVTHTVPDNCIYITIEICGKIAYYKEERNNHLRLPYDSPLYKYPYLNLTKGRLAELLYLPQNEIRVHLPGQSYAASHFDPLATWYDPTYMKIRYTGLCEKRDLEANPDIVHADDFPFSPGQPFPYIEKAEVIRKFSASSYPTRDRVSHALRDLPDRFQPRTIYEGRDYLTRITETIQEEYGFFRGISREDGPDAFFSNTYLMGKFPGIHYNVICRGVTCASHYNSDRAVRRRRADSDANLGLADLSMNDDDFVWAVLDKIDRVENDDFKRSINPYTRPWKLAHPR